MNILFCGASGFGNIGDDAYRHVFSRYLSDEYNLFFDSPYPDLELVGKMDYVVIGGGGVIYDNDTDHFKYMSMYLDKAKKNNIPFSFSACGLQFTNPVQNRNDVNEMASSIKRWKGYLDEADVVTVRCRRSIGILNQLSSSINAHYYPDLCYLIEPVPYSLIQPGSVSIVLTQSISGDSDAQKVIAKYDHYGKKRYAIVTSRIDEEYSIAWAKDNIPDGGKGHFRYRINLTPQEAAAIFRDSVHVISSRYHGHVFARAGGRTDDEITIIGKTYKNEFEEPPADLSRAEGHINKLEKHIT